MPTYRDFAVSLAMGWAASTGFSHAWSAEGAIPLTAPVQSVPQAVPQATEKTVELEVIRERYPDRSVKVERHAVQDAALNYLNHGPWTMWDPAGAIVAKGEYWQGKRHGEWKRYYLPAAEKHPEDLPDKSDKATAAEDAFDGPEFKGFNKPFTSVATFVEDKIVGTWSVTDADGRTLFSLELDRNVPQGKAQWFYAGGNKRREIDFKQGVIDGLWQEFDADGASTRKDTYIEGRRQAEGITRFESGEKSSEGMYLYAKENIRVDFDWWTSAVRVTMLGTEGKPIKQGKWNYWYEDGGKRCEAEYIDDKPVARHVWWYRNGQKECEGEFVDGRSQGTWVYWHENGQKAAQGDYFNGTKVGKWVRWSNDGKVVDAKDHPYVDVSMQSVPVNRAIQARSMQAMPAPVTGSNVPSTVPTGPGYPIGLVPGQQPVAQQPGIQQQVIPQPGAAPAYQQPYQLQPIPQQPSQGAMKPKSGFRLR